MPSISISKGGSMIVEARTRPQLAIFSGFGEKDPIWHHDISKGTKWCGIRQLHHDDSIRQLHHGLRLWKLRSVVFPQEGHRQSWCSYNCSASIAWSTCCCLLTWLKDSLTLRSIIQQPYHISVGQLAIPELFFLVVCSRPSENRSSPATPFWASLALHRDAPSSPFACENR